MWVKRRGDIMKRDRATGIIAALLGVLVAVYAWMLPKSGICGEIS